MANEKDPVAVVKAELTEHETDDEKREREAREAKALEDTAHEKRGEELHAIDTKVTKLCEDVESWKTQTFSAIEKMANQLQESTRQVLEAHQTPQPVVPQNPPAPIQPVEPVNPETPPKDADDHPAPKTKAKTVKRGLRYL